MLFKKFFLLQSVIVFWVLFSFFKNLKTAKKVIVDFFLLKIHSSVWKLFDTKLFIFDIFCSLSRLPDCLKTKDKKCREQKINYLDRAPEKLSLNTCDQVVSLSTKYIRWHLKKISSGTHRICLLPSICVKWFDLIPVESTNRNSNFGTACP